MIFSINSIQLWLKRDYSPNSNVIRLDFFKDKVNVITGDASTGKSSILDIIDYCLLSDLCSTVA
jgi:predicted ATP-binding protein involved in virulence